MIVTYEDIKASDFVDELIHYIFNVQDADDDNLSAEVICRKLVKHGLIDNVDGYYQPKDDFSELKKRTKKQFRAVWLDDELNEIGAPKTDYPCDTCVNKGDHDGECKNCVADSEIIRWKTPSHYKPKQTERSR